MRDREALINLLERSMTAMGVTGTFLAVIASGQSWLVAVCGGLLALVAVAITIDFVYYMKPLGVPWRSVRTGITRMIDQLAKAKIAPDIIIGAGRSGSVVGATLAANLKHRPFIALDIQHEWIDDAREIRPDGPVSLKLSDLRDKRVLVVFGNIRSAETFKAVRQYLLDEGLAKEQLSYATLFLHPDAPLRHEGVPLCYGHRKGLDNRTWSAAPWHITKTYDYR